LTTPSPVLNISLVSSFKIRQIDKLPDPPFPISFSIRKSNPKFNIKNAGNDSNSILFHFIIIDLLKESNKNIKRNEKKKN